MKINGVDLQKKKFQAILLFVLELCFKFIEFFSSAVLLFLTYSVLCFLCSMVNVYDASNDLIRVCFSLRSSFKKECVLLTLADRMKNICLLKHSGFFEGVPELKIQ